MPAVRPRTGVAVLLAALALSVPAHAGIAQKCRRLCWNEITGCVINSALLGIPRYVARPACRQGFVRECRIDRTICTQAVLKCGYDTPIDCGEGHGCCPRAAPVCGTVNNLDGCCPSGTPILCRDFGRPFCCPNDSPICGDGVCLRTPVTTIPPVTTTTIQDIPRSTSGTITDDSCRMLWESAFVSFTVHPGFGWVDFSVSAQQPQFFFCWSGHLDLVQGARQIGVSGFGGDARLTLNDGANTCDTYQPGTQLTGRISNFPAGFDLGSPFRAVFDYTFCTPEWCGACEMQL